jgi:hypothetical protein
MTKKPAITGLARPAGFWDDAAKEAAKYAPSVAKKLGSQFARTATKKRAMAKTKKMAEKHMDVMRKAGKNWAGGK